MWWTAERAAGHLGVKRKTLYTYVSRGWVRSQSAGGRRRVYLADDVRELARRADESRGRAAAAGAAMRWGPPVLTTELSAVDPDGPYYRGRSALAFSEAGTPLEEVAAHLLGHPVRVGASREPRGEPPSALADVACRVLLDAPPEDTGAALGAVVGAVGWWMGREPGGGAVATRLAAVFGVEDVPLDAALALCVDHELNASTFAARVAAGTGAGLGACLRSALATWSGPRHGMASEVLEDELDAEGALSNAAFGHPFYPRGDPRAEQLFALSERPAWANDGPAPPNLDAGLVAFRRSWDLPRGAAAALFLVGRTVGWCAHVAEQRGQPMLRPRAHYVGPTLG